MINRNTTKKFIRLSVIIFIIAIILGYSYYAFSDYIKGPEIIISSPENGSTIATSTAKILGQALRIKDIYLNDRPILIDDKGFFNETLLLFPGYNVALLRANDKFNRTIEYKLELVYEKE